MILDEKEKVKTILKFSLSSTPRTHRVSNEFEESRQAEIKISYFLAVGYSLCKDPSEIGSMTRSVELVKTLLLILSSLSYK